MRESIEWMVDSGMKQQLDSANRIWRDIVLLSELVCIYFPPKRLDLSYCGTGIYIFPAKKGVNGFLWSSNCIGPWKLCKK